MKWNKIIKRIFIILILNCLFINIINSQSLLYQIEHSYKTLDSSLYLKNIIFSYREDLVIRHYATIETLSKPSHFSSDTIQRQNLIDSLLKEMSPSSRIWIEDQSNKLISEVTDKPVCYVLNLVFKNSTQLSSHSFQPDTSRLPYNLLCFDKRFKPILYVFVADGKFGESDTLFPTFSKKAAKNVPKIYRNILRKHPKYILHCNQLENGNTIWYVLNDKIYVYRILQLEEYALNDYMKKLFGVDTNL